MVASLRRALRASVLGLGRAIEWGGTKFQIVGLWIEGLVSRRRSESEEEEPSLNDELDRGELAGSLARYIANIDPESEGARDRKSTTIGVYGEWGSGKTYLKNLILGEFRQMDVEVPFVEYNPWQWSAQQKLTESFFDTLEKKFRGLGATGKPDAEKYAKISERLRKLSLLTAAFGPSPKAIAVLQTLLFGLIAYFLGTSNWNEWSWTYQVMTITGTGVGLGLWFMGRLAEKLASWMEISSSRAERSLEQVKQDLTELFADLDQPFLVVIDDIDRLTADQIRMMMQLIKANADFPNVVYLVLFEREIVTGSLSDDENNIDGAKFLEKIVHLSFDLPEAEQQTLVEEFKARLSRELDSRKIPEPVSEQLKDDIEGDTRLSSIIEGFVPHFVNTLRNVNRVIPTFVFYLEHFTDLSERTPAEGDSEKGEVESYLEIDAGDLLALELLRIFEPEVYERIPDHKGMLTSPIPFFTTSSNRREDVLNDLLQSVEEPDDVEEAVGKTPRRDTVRKLIEYLFPRITQTGRTSTVDQSEIERRVDHPDLFNRYFGRRISGSVLRKAEIDQILESVDDRDELVGLLNEHIEKGQLSSVLNEIEARIDDIERENLETLLTALFDVGGNVSFETDGKFETPSVQHAGRLVRGILRRRLDDPDERTDLLEGAIEATDGVLLPSYVVLNATQANDERLNADASTPIYSEKGLERCQTLAVEIIERESEDGALLNHKHKKNLLHNWISFGGGSDLAQWIRETLDEDSSSALRVIEAFSHDTSGPRQVAVNAQNLSSIGVLEPLREAADEIEREELDSKEAALVSAFENTYQRQMQQAQADREPENEEQSANTNTDEGEDDDHEAHGDETENDEDEPSPGESSE